MRWHEAPLVPLAAAFALGICGGSWMAASTSWLLVAGGLLLTLAACSLALGWERVAMVGLLSLAAALGALRAASDPLPADHIARVALGPLVSVEGRLAEEPVRWEAIDAVAAASRKP